MDFHKFITRYKQFGGAKLVWQYAKLGILPVVLRGVVRCVVKRQSFKAIYPEVLRKIERYRLRLCEADMKQLVGLPQQSNYYGERCRFSHIFQVKW